MRTKFPNKEPQQADRFIFTMFLEAFRSSSFYNVNKLLVKKLGLVDAFVLSDYIDKYLYFEKSNEDFDGSFYLTRAKQAENLNLSIYDISRSKQRLIDLNLISTSRTNEIPSKELISLNVIEMMKFLHSSTAYINLVRQALPSHEGYSDNSPLGGISSLKENKLKINKNFSQPNKNEKYLPLAKYLSKIIQSKKNINHTLGQIKQWSISIRQLCEMNSVSIERVNNALVWYEDNVGGEFIPVIESGKSLKEKFYKLEASMERSKTPKSGKKEKYMQGGEWYYLQQDGKYRNRAGRLYDGDYD